MTKNYLIIRNLNVSMSVDGSTGSRQLLQGINLTVKSGEIHALMGPNGAGKTTLAMSLMGNPKYNFKFHPFGRLRANFKFQINGEEMRFLKPEERAGKGLFVAFQQPVEIEGLSVFSLLRNGYNSLLNKKLLIREFRDEVKRIFREVLIQEDFLERSLNGFSGGEKKKLEVAQLLLFKPKFAILDEIDSGLDVDSLKAVVSAIKFAAREYHTGIILITHQPRLFKYLKPDFVHVLKNGEIKKTDGISIIRKIEKEGYAGF